MVPLRLAQLREFLRGLPGRGRGKTAAGHGEALGLLPGGDLVPGPK